MSIKEQITQELDRLSEAELVQVARYVAFLKYQARVEAAPAIEGRKVGALCGEFGQEDRDLAEEGTSDYARGLHEEEHDEHVKEVYAHFGLAAYLSQVLEHGIVNAMIYCDLIPSNVGKVKSQAEWEVKFDSFMGKHFEVTLGRMIRNLASVLTVPPQLETVLGDALKRRNWLAHHYFRERAETFMSESGRDQMIAELEAAQELFRRADELLSTTVKPMREHYGFTDKRLEDIARDYAKKVGADL